MRLYAPSLKFVDLAAPGYYFSRRITPNVMRWLAADDRSAPGATLKLGTAFTGMQRQRSGFMLDGLGSGAIRDRRRRAALEGRAQRGLGVNERFLAGVEYELAGATLADA